MRNLAEFRRKMDILDKKRADREKGRVEQLREAAEQGHISAQRLLGEYYFNGWGIPQDKEEATNWYRKSAEQGNTEAQWRLAECYFEGEGVPQDKEEAIVWWRKASAQNGQYADYSKYRLGKCYYDGDGVPKSKTEAIKWLQKASEKGHKEATDLLRQIEGK